METGMPIKECTKQIIVKITGGLGNQLWQYFAGLALLALKRDQGHKVELCLDISHYHSRDAKWDTPRTFVLHKLFPGIKISKKNLSQGKCGYAIWCETRAFSFAEEFKDLSPPLILQGHFQHYRYFELAKKYIAPRLKKLPHEIQVLDKNHDLVALHVRRGDFLKGTDPSGLAPLAYYKGALREIIKEVPNICVILFSDDIDWVKKYLEKELHGLSFLYSNRDTITDFSIMVQCQHFIIANSTFSNMAALLGATVDSFVFSPVFRLQALNIYSSDCLPANWKTPMYSFYEDLAPENPAVSIIIPVYNTAAYLDRCLESVCGQSEQNIEIIVIDDASPDNSWQLIQSYAKLDRRIAAIHHPKNKHLGGARNTGIEAAKGDWLLFLDSDDYIRTDTVEVLLQKAGQYPEQQLIACGIWSVSATGKIEEYGAAETHSDYLVEQVLEHFCHNRKPTLRRYAWGKLWRRELFISSQIRFPEHIALEDLAAIPRLYAALDKALVIPDRLFYYQQREDRVTGHYSVKWVEDLGCALDLLETWRLNLPPNLQRVVLAKMAEVCRGQVYGVSLDGCREHGGEPFALLLESALAQENPTTALHYILDSEQGVLAHRLQHLSQHIQPFLGYLLLYQILEQEQWQRSDAYRFGKFSRKRKLWFIAKKVSQKLHLYSFLRPFAHFLARIIVGKIPK